MKLASRWVVLGLALAGPVVLVGEASAAGSFSLEQVLSAPFPSDLVAAPAGGRVAWVFDAEGVRNVWLAEPGQKARALTRYAEDDGQALGHLRFTPDGASLVYVRGGGPNHQGELPNPTSNPKGALQQVWIVSAGGGEPRLLGEGHSPEVSPAGDRVALVRKGGIVLVPLGAGATETRVEVRGGVSHLRWSPDGSRLAFVSNRGDHGFVGVYVPATSSIRFLEPSFGRDLSPAWSPDGTRLAFVRLPATDHRLPFMPHRAGPPWSIRVADAHTGEGREVFHADPGRGSVFRSLAGEESLLWTADGRLVFPWEADGWLHLYSIPAAGGNPVALTPGAFEVESAALDADGRSLLLTSNQGDIDRRHLWRVAATGGAPVALSSGDGIEWGAVATSDGRLVCLRSDARRPARPATIEKGSLADLAPETLPAGFPASSLVVPEPVLVTAADGLTVHAQLFRPPDGSGRRHPAVLFFHGGSRRQMLLGWHYMGYYNNAYAFNQYLASRGYVVLSVNYRSGIGYGLDFREAEGYGASGASEFQDVLGAGLYLAGLRDVDPKRIGLWGGSYGGYLTALGLARASDLFAAGVDFHGVHDWNVVIWNFVRDYEPLAHPELARLARESSPIASVTSWRSPVLLIQGDDDRNVPFSESVDMAAALRKQGVPFEELVFPDEVHGFLRHESWLRAYTAAAAFLDRHLAAARP